MSVLMPAYNACAYVGEAVASVLTQTFADLELVVVDDASTDGTARAIERFRDPRLVYVRNEQRLGVVETLNRGLDVVRGALVSRHDADDVSEPERLAVHVEMFERDPGLVIAGSAMTLIDEGGRVVGTKGRPLTDTGIRWRALFLMPGIGAFTCRTDVVRRHGIRFRVGGAAEDHGFWFDMLQAGRAANSAQALYRYRVHGAQASRAGFDRQNAESEKLAREALARLGVEVRLEDVPALRDIYLEPPRARDASWLRHFAAMLAAARALAREPGVDAAELRELERSVLAKLLVAYRGRPRLLAALLLALRTDPGWTVRAALGAR